MPLPPLIELEPLPGPVRADVTVPGSKSVTNRALVLAALASGETELRGALWSEDTQVMVECLQELGFLVTVAPDPAEAGNRTITVYGQGGRVPRGGTEGQPLELFVGNAGTAARFLAALVCLGDGVYRLHGVPRMHERPQAALFAALRSLGYRIESPTDRLPVVIWGGGPRPGRCRVSLAESSQFASALLLGAGVGGWEIEWADEAEPGTGEEAPYVRMTSELCRVFPRGGGVFQIEPDASSGSYFWGANALLSAGGAGGISVLHWPASGWQVDARFPGLLPLPPEVSRRRDLGDSILTALVVAPFGERPTRFTDLGRLRVQECERVVAMRTELAKCGVRVEEVGDTLTVWPSPVRGAEVATYGDHRVAMSFAILGLKVPGLRLQNPACVKKTFPNFFLKLAAPPPHGLGAVIRAGRRGPILRGDDLAADLGERDV
jgi:3-phosphoshikimate 1-carboxyvinyltransferase